MFLHNSKFQGKGAATCIISFHSFALPLGLTMIGVLLFMFFNQLVVSQPGFVPDAVYSLLMRDVKSSVPVTSQSQTFQLRFLLLVL